MASKEAFSLNPFYYHSEKILGNVAYWGMTGKSAGSMRFRWNEKNQTRNIFFQKILAGRNDGETNCEKVGEKNIVPLELIHSKIIFDAKTKDDTLFKQGDGIITQNKNLIPTLTVADCLPIFFFDVENEVFGLVHSGWKGTGIIRDAILFAKKKYGSNPKNICIAFGAHIHSCCYIVTEERANFFRKEFSEDCVTKYERSGAEIEKWNSQTDKLYRLSLEKANLSVLERCGILDENIVLAKDCTCCTANFFSYRRQMLEKNNSEENVEEQNFSVNAAFCGYMAT